MNQFTVPSIQIRPYNYPYSYTYCTFNMQTEKVYGIRPKHGTSYLIRIFWFLLNWLKRMRLRSVQNKWGSKQPLNFQS